ncbi:MAG TPA: D-erythronate dehydrogenase [Burkholderiales bacterium]|jgi:nucleoside-diphosphate-sugar epimerase|nr:D-erythronate dehydrogenase [Burkholderiales bacterium]
MKVFITGGGGFLGYRLALKLLERRTLAGPDGKPAAISGIKLFDAAFPPDPDPRLTCIKGDIAELEQVENAMDRDTASVFHLAAVVSAHAEQDFDMGYRVNLDGTRNLLEASRDMDAPPRFVFASSLAVYGGALPPVVDDSVTPTPQTSYGTQKVIGEYLVNDYSRKGMVDGRSLRLPTIVVRPGKPNLASTSFASGMFREPLNGTVCEVPVEASTEMWILSPGKVLDAFLHAHDLPASAWGTNRALALPGITFSVGEGVEALRRIAGDEVARRVVFRKDDRINRMVRSFPGRFRTDRALAMGFRADADIAGILRDYIAAEGIRLPGAPLP